MCNRYKADRTTSIDHRTKLALPLFHPHQHVWDEHFAWNVSADEILPLTAIGRATADLLRMNRLQIVRTRRLWIALGEHPPTIV